MHKKKEQSGWKSAEKKKQKQKYYELRYNGGKKANEHEPKGGIRGVVEGE